MLVFVPQGYVALVYEDGALRAVVEAGVGVVDGRLQVQYVYLQPQGELQEQGEDMAAPATLQ